MDEPLRVRDLMDRSGLPGLEARMLLQHVLRVPRAWLITHDTDMVPAGQAERFERLRGRRLAGEPMAYLLGRREFMGHDFRVSPDVLIPRPDTELLVETAIKELDGRRAPRMLDLGTGSGAVAVSVALACPQADVLATDSSGAALDVARRNARDLHASVEFRQGDWYGALPAGGLFDLIVSNPPYIAAGDPHLGQGDLRFEPQGALTDGADGLGALRVIVGGARAWLGPQGALWVEHGWDQAASVRRLLSESGFQRVRSRRDLAGIERISGGVADDAPAVQAEFAAAP